MKGILLNENNDLAILVKKDKKGLITGGLMVDRIKIQVVYLVLKLNQGELKEDPIIGTNLLCEMRGVFSKERLKKVIKIGLSRAGIDFEDVKQEIATIINKQNIEL